jgi:predicted secreted hydrolase
MRGPRNAAGAAPDGGLVTRRRHLLLAGTLAPWAGAARSAGPEQAAPRPLVFPRDHGAHPAFGIEWWYVTGWLHADDAGAAATPSHGFQLTFFRSRTGLAEAVESRFAPRQLLFAHAALTDLAARRLVHAERIARWNGTGSAVQAAASLDDTALHIGAWRFARDGAGTYRAAITDDAAGFAFDATLTPTQPLLLQGDAGFSRKGPSPGNASHYYSQPQLDVSATLKQGRTSRPVRGRAWLDHEWSGSLMPERAVGWDWIGINLDDGGALTAFRLRDAAGAAVWAGGSLRAAGSTEVRAFGAAEVRFEPIAQWTSAATGAHYAVRWRVSCPAGVFEVRALLDAQELDNRATTGTVYWEGLSVLNDAGGARVGLGYLEMTGYAAPLRLN